MRFIAITSSANQRKNITVKATTIGLVDDHPATAKGIECLLTEHTAHTVLFYAANGLQMQERLKKEPLPDLLVLDLNMPVMNGFEALAWLQKTHPALPAIVYTGLETDLSTPLLILDGARSIVDKRSPIAELIKAIDRVYEDGFYFNNPLSRTLFHELLRTADKKAKIRPLFTYKEWQFLRYVATDLTYREIAIKLRTSEKMISNISQEVLRKLGVNTRVTLAKKVLENGLASTPATEAPQAKQCRRA